MIKNSWNTEDAWSDYVSTMRLVLPEPDLNKDSNRDPGRWVSLPGLCCQAAGGELETTLEISAAWLLLYTAAHIVDTVEDGDQDPQINLLGGTGAAINTANGLFLSATLLLNSMQKKVIPKDLAAEITTDYLQTILVMTNGQHLDITIPQIDLNQWWQIAEAKSGAFFSLACRAGAQFGTNDSQKIKAFSDYGFHLGLMLQIIDDLEDFHMLLRSMERLTPRFLDRSLAVAYADNVLPASAKIELTQIINTPLTQSGSRDKVVDLLDESGAGLYMVAELEKHFDQAKSSLVGAQPVQPAGEKLEAIIRALKLN